MAGPLLLVLLVGSFTAAVSAWGLGALLGASRESLISLATKSVTTPIAMAVAERLGGLASLTAVLVIVTGIVGALCASSLYRWLRVDDPAVRGFALGLAAHGIGTARAFQLGEQVGAFAALGMGLNGLLTSFALPWLLPWLERLLLR
jgi:putative effector of murein hydrolase